MAQFNEKKYPVGLLNADDEFNMVGANEYVNATNLRFGSTDDGAVLRFEKIGGTDLIFNTFLTNGATDAYTNLAACEDEARQRIIFITFQEDNLAGTNLNAIYCYDKAANTTYTVLKYDQVTPVSLLQFSKDKYIDAIRVWGDLLYWTEGTGEVRVINIESGIKLNHGGYSTTVPAYVSPLKAEDIVLIKRPCIYPPVAVKSYDSGYTSNNIGNKAWQFSYIYEYADFQQSVVGTWSLTVDHNRKEENFNRITVSMPLTEDIPQTVRKVKLVAKQLDTNTADVVKVWDKDITADATAIATHNAGTVDADRLSFICYYDRIIETLADATVAKIEENIPRDVQTLEVSNDRLFLANFASGFNGKGITSLSVTPVTGTGLTTATISLDLYLVEAIVTDNAVTPTVTKYFRGYFVNFAQANPAGWYPVTGAYNIQTGSYPSVTAPTGTVTLDKYCGTEISNVVNVLYTPDISTTSYTSTDTTTNVDVTIYRDAGTRWFKTNGAYSVGICFYDQFHRIVEAQAPDNCRFSTPQNVGGILASDNVLSVTCAVSNTNALNEIPDDAYYYGFIITNNLTTRNYLQFREDRFRYGRKNDDGTYELKLSSPDDVQYISIPLSTLIKNGLGYTFTEGDLLRYHLSLTTTPAGDRKGTLRVVGVVGKYLLCDFVNLGALNAISISYGYFELFTPYKQTGSEFYYEVGNKYVVNNPGTGSRAYSTLSHSIAGDTALLLRSYNSSTNFYAEAMSLNDTFPYRWFTDAGRPIAIVKNKKIQQTNYVAWSGQRFLGTQINGSSAFELNNLQPVSVEAGAIRKLQNANRLQEEGGVMLAICERETLSLYVGRAQVSDETQFNLLLKTDTVIGTVNGLRGSFGTRHPESVVEYRGNVYWFDVVNGAFVKYSGNGLFDISSYKLRRITTLFAARVRELTINDSSVNEFRNRILGGIDVKHGEILWSIPETYTTPPKGRLSDYSNTADYNYPYDLYDGTAKTLVFKDLGDRWMGAFSFSADGFVSLNNELYSLRNGLHKHNKIGGYNTFYGGTAAKSKLAVVFNQEAGIVRVPKAVALECNTAPDWTHFRTEWPYVQSSELLASEWDAKEGVYYGKLYKDRLSPNTAGSVNQKMTSGDDLKGQYILMNMEFNGGGDQLNLRIATLLYNKSLGHKL